jgi:anti-sigma factor (TIGR02949 family)
MNSKGSGETACETIAQDFDGYLDNELSPDARRNLLEHLANCPVCTANLEARSRLKNAVKRAVTQQDVPDDLEKSIQEKLRNPRRQGLFGLYRRQWALAAAASVLVALGGFIMLRSGLYIEEIMHIGLIDHIHCTLELERWKKPVSFEEMRQASGRNALGPEFIEMIPLMKENLGPDFEIVQGHRCRTEGREYVHVIVTGQKGAILSLVISEKSGESLTAAQAAATLGSGLPVYQHREQELEVVAFETERFLSYVVSNLDGKANMQVASRLVPAVEGYLRQLGA